jgi:predicted Zn finger-like uncharacterized protein
VIVQCPYCATSYQLDPARLTSKSPMLKCSRCRHVFAAPTSKRRGSTPPSPRRAARTADENLELPFDEPTWKDEAEPSPSADLKISEPEEAFTLGVDEKPDDLALPETPAEEEAAVVTPRATARHQEEEPERGEEAEVEPDEEPEEEEAVEEPRRRGVSTVTPILIFLAMVLAGYGLLTRALFASPTLCDKLVGRLPLIGRLGDDRLLTRKVALSDVVGSYQRIKDGKEVFVITGKALNTAPVALRSVQIVGRLFDAGGQALDEKVIYCGNVISAKVLKDLTPRELSILQKLSPPTRFMIEPGESSTFVIVFMDPPRAAAEFSAQVVAAQHQA